MATSKTNVLLIGSGLMFRSFQALRAVDPGFEAEDVLVATVTVPETEVALAAIEQGMLWLAIAIVASSLLAVVYVWRIVEAGYFRPVPEDVRDRREAGAGYLVPLWLLVIANIYFGVETSLTVGAAGGAAESLLGAAP